MESSNNRFASLASNKNNNKFLNQRNNKNPRHNKFQRNSHQNRFKMNEKKIEKKEMCINIDEKSFPSLIKSVESKKEEELSDKTKEMLYIEKIKYFKELNQKEELLPKGFTILSNIKVFNRYQEVNIDKNSYYNPNLSVKILYERYNNRQELNDILGDISPYCDMDDKYDYDTRDIEENLHDNESYDSDYSEFDEYYDNY